MTETETAPADGNDMASAFGLFSVATPDDATSLGCLEKSLVTGRFQRSGHRNEIKPTTSDRSRENRYRPISRLPPAPRRSNI